MPFCQHNIVVFAIVVFWTIHSATCDDSSDGLNPPYHWHFVSSRGVPHGLEKLYNNCPVVGEYYFPGGRRRHAMAAIHESVYIYGGSVRSSCQGVRVLGDLWRYDLSLFEWELIGPIHSNGTHGSGCIFQNCSLSGPYPGGRMYSHMHGTDDALFLFGGEGYSSSTAPPLAPPSEHPYGFLQDVWKFDATTRKWEFFSVAKGSESWIDVEDQYFVPPIRPSGRAPGCTWLLNDGRLFLHGGGRVRERDGFAAWYVMWTFSETNLWTYVGTLGPSEPGYFPSCWKEHTERYLYSWAGAGYYFSRFWPYNIHTLNQYDISMSSWRQYRVCQFDSGRKRYGGVYFAFQTGIVTTKGFVFSGSFDDDTDDLRADMSLFNLDSGDFWESRLNLTSDSSELAYPNDPVWEDPGARPEGRIYSGIAQAGNQIVMYGGDSYNGYLSDVWKMVLPSAEPHFPRSCNNYKCADGKWIDDVFVCSGNGRCYFSGGPCICNWPWGGETCNLELDCFGSSAATDPCGQHGICTDFDVCECSDGFVGDRCHEFYCADGRKSSDPQVCSGNGNCVEPNGTCICNQVASGPSCGAYRSSMMAIAISVPLSVLLLVVCVAVVAGMVGLLFCICEQKRILNDRLQANDMRIGHIYEVFSMLEILRNLEQEDHHGDFAVADADGIPLPVVGDAVQNKMNEIYSQQTPRSLRVEIRQKMAALGFDFGFEDPCELVDVDFDPARVDAILRQEITVLERAQQNLAPIAQNRGRLDIRF